MNCTKKLCKHHGSTRTGCEKYWNPSSPVHILNLKKCDDFDVLVKLTNRKEIVYADKWNIILKARMHSMNMQQKDLARKSGLSVPTVGATLTRGRKPKIDTLRAICAVLGFQLSDIISGNTDFVRGNYNA